MEHSANIAKANRDNAFKDCLDRLCQSKNITFHIEFDVQDTYTASRLMKSVESEMA